MAYELYYWPGLPGRGEFVRLALEDCGARYKDVALDEHATDKVMSIQKGHPRPSFAPPFLKSGKQLIGQTANILFYLGERHGLTPKAESGKLWINQVQLTIADLVAEAHDSHHPVSSGLYYKEQKKEARRRAQDFREKRMPKFLGYFESLLKADKNGPYLLGRKATYADLSLFHIVEGLQYAYPQTMKPLMRKYRNLKALQKAVAERPNIAAYMQSGRRQAFSEDGIFRHYPELDTPA